MKTATIRDLRTRFPHVRRLLEQEGEVVVTHRGHPVIVLRAFEQRAPQSGTKLNYFARLRRRMPKPLSSAAHRALREADRAER